MNQLETISKQTGEAFAALLYGVKPSELTTVKSASIAITADPAFGRKVAALAVDMLAAGEGQLTDSFSVYAALTKEATWTEEHSAMLNPFLEALATVDRAYTSAIDEAAFSKAAGDDKGGGAIEAVTNLLGLGRKGYSDYFKSILSLGLMGGLASGSAHWALNQDVSPVQDTKPPLEAEIASKEAERDYYRRIRDETEDRMRRSLSSRNPGREVARASQYV